MRLSDLAKRMIIIILIITLICILGSIIYYRSFGFIPFLFGVMLGSVISIARVFLLDRAVDRALTMEKKRAAQYLSLQNILRILLSGFALVIGAIIPQINLWGVVAGILAYSLAAYSTKFKSKS